MPGRIRMSAPKVSPLLNLVLLAALVTLLVRQSCRGGGPGLDYGEFPPQIVNNSNNNSSNNSSNNNSSRLLCLVLTTPHNHRLKAVHVQATWGRRCSELGEVTPPGNTVVLQKVPPEGS